MNIAILMIADNIIKLIDTSEYSKMKSVFKEMDILCPSCKTKLKYIKKSDGSDEFIAEANSYHSICKKEVTNNFYIPINKELFLKLSEGDINKYLNIICSEYKKFLEMPISNMVKSKISNYKVLDFTKTMFNNNNDYIVEVKEIASFLKDPREKVFLVSEISGCYLGDEYIYIDLVAGANKVSVCLEKRLINTLNNKEVNLIRSINNKKKRFILALYIDRINLKRNNGINITAKSKKFINIHEIK